MELDFLAESWKSIAPQWQDFLKQSSQDELCAIDGKLTKLAQEHTIYPPAKEILRALRNPLSAIKVVILGQDPYHGDGEANGLAFAVNSGIKTPPSLRNIFKERATQVSKRDIQRVEYFINLGKRQLQTLTMSGTDGFSFFGRKEKTS